MTNSPITTAANEIRESQAALLREEITADEFRRTMRTLRETLGEDDYTTAKAVFASAVL